MALAAAATVGSVTPAGAQARCEPVGPDRIHACLRGSGGPAVVLAAGAGQDGRTWSPIEDELASVARVVTFDRPGLGRSPSVGGPRTPTAIAQEIRAVLAWFEVEAPVVLVGHSMGGIHALRFTELFPEFVAGVVLIDTPPRDFERERLGLLSPDEQEQRAALLAGGRARTPEVVGRERDGAATDDRPFVPLPEATPLSVVVADSQDFGELGDTDAHRRLWLLRSRDWLELAERSEWVVAEGSGHMVHHDRPGLVLEVLRRMLGGAP